MGRLDGKVAVITGANSGIGLACARRFAQEGARVFMTGRRQAELDAAVSEVGGNARGVQGDIADLADLDRLYAAVRAEAPWCYRRRAGDSAPALGTMLADRFEDLRNFVMIAEAGGVNAAAARLGIAKSAVSRRFAEFEQRIGIDLTDRSGRRFSLTTAGAAVLADAQRLLADLERLENRRARAAEATIFEVGAHADLLDVVAQAAADLRRTMPDVRIILSASEAASERLTFSIGGGDGQRSKSIGPFASGVYAALGIERSPLTAADLRDVPAVSIAGAGPAEWRFDGIEASPRIIMTVSDLRTALAAAAAGAGVVRAPTFAVRSGPWASALRAVIRPRTADVTVTVGLPASSSAVAERLVDIVARLLATD